MEHFKRGGRLHGALSRNTGFALPRFRGNATIPGLLYQNKFGWYPCLKPGNGLVHGELYEKVSDTLLSYLDMVEGHPTLFERRKVKTTDGEAVWAYFYVPPVTGMEVIPDGKFNVAAE